MALEQAFPLLNTPMVDPQSGQVAIPWYQFFISLWNRTGGAAGGSQVQPGLMGFWGSATPPDGWYICNGTAISRANNQDLFGVIGTTFGAGDGVSTFNLPNFTNRVPIGAGGAYALGGTGGATSVTLSVSQMPAHSHGVTDPGHTHIQDPHAHGQQLASNNTAGTAGTQGGTAVNNLIVGTTAGATPTNQSAFTGLTINTTGGADPVDTLPPYLGMYVIIKS